MYLRPITTTLLAICLTAGSAISAEKKTEKSDFSEIVGKYQGTATYADPAVGLGPFAMPATILVKAKGKKLVLTVTSAFPSTWGPATTYPFAIQVTANGRNLTGTVSGAAIVPATGTGKAKFKKNKLTGSVVTSLLGGIATDKWIFTIPITAKFSKDKLTITTSPTDNLGFSWGSAIFVGKRK